VHANSSELALLSNWARACRVGQIQHLLLLALDNATVAKGARLGLPTLACVPFCLMPTASDEHRCRVSPLLAASNATAPPGRAAIVAVAQALLVLGHDVLLSEADVVR
jgi:hypothetical protein